jgi:hypothetical protein
VRLPRLLEDLSLARADGRYPCLLTSLASTLITSQLLVDRWHDTIGEGKRQQ